MKRTLMRLMCAVVAMTALVSCQKEKFSENGSFGGEKIEVSIVGSIGDFVTVDDTKAAAQSVVRVTWAQDDEVYVYDGSACLGTLTVTPDAKNASYALLSGTITASSLVTAPDKLTLVYSNTATEAPAISEGKVSIDLSNQSEADVPFVLYATIDYDAAKLEKTEEYIPFSFATSVMTVNVTDLPTGTENAVINITKAEIDEVSTVCELTISASEEPTVAGASKGVITRSAGFAQSDSRGTFTIAVAAEAAAQSARRILVYQEAKVSGAPFATTTTFAENKSYNTVCQLSEYVQSVPDGMLPGEFTVSADGKKVHFSQGNLWYGKVGDAQTSTFNFETNQYDRQNSWDASHVSYFFWSKTESVAYANSYSDEGANKNDVLFINDQTNAEKARTDFTVNGVTGKYRALSKAECVYLFDTRAASTVSGTSNARYAKAKVNGIEGLILLPDTYVHPSGVTELTKVNIVDASYDWNKYDLTAWEKIESAGAVFLPAAGSYDGSSVINSNGSYADGYYWSSNSNTGSNTSAYSVYFYSNFVYSDFNPNRNSGRSIRLITELEGYAPAVKVTGISLASSKDTVEVGASKALVATVTPSNAAHQEINWSSSDETVATVDENGEVTGVAAGLAIITATTVDGNFSASSLVTVEEAADGPLAGVFTVADDGKGNVKKVQFSKGNLWVDNSLNLHFEDEQYAFNANIDANHVSHFTWSSTVQTAVSSTNSGTFLFCNGDNKQSVEGSESIYYALSSAEWNYLLRTRTVNGGTGQDKSFSFNITYGSKVGTVIYPDNYSGAILSGTVQTLPEGVVFLPLAGYVSKSAVSSISENGCYWCSDSNDGSSARYLYLVTGSLAVGNSNSIAKSNQFCIRLVTDVKE